MKISKLLECAEGCLLTLTVYRKSPRGDCKADMKTDEKGDGRKL